MRTIFTLGIFLLAMFAEAAHGVISNGMAVTLCKAEVDATYAEARRTKLARVRSRSSATEVILRVFGATAKPLKLACRVDGEGRVLELAPVTRKGKVGALSSSKNNRSAN